MRSALHYPASTSISSADFGESVFDATVVSNIHRVHRKESRIDSKAKLLSSRGPGSVLGAGTARLRSGCGSAMVITADSAAESVISSLAGFAGVRRPHPPGARTGIPAARKYPPTVSRRICTAASMRRRDHPRRPQRDYLLSFIPAQDITHADGGYSHRPNQCSGSVRPLAGFQAIIDGRLGVIPEAKHTGDIIVDRTPSIEEQLAPDSKQCQRQSA
jgi:hypothetical protein